MDMRIIRILFIALTLLQTAIDTVYGGSSQTIGVSCIIPAIPGVNAPLNEVQKETQAISEEGAKVNEGENQERSSTLIVQDTQVATQNADGSMQLATVKTFYSR